MGCRCRDAAQKAGSYQFRAIEVAQVPRFGTAGAEGAAGVLVVENDWETLGFVKDNLGELAANMVRAKQMKFDSAIHVEESAELFERHLEPFFTLISATCSEHVLDKLSVSLRKALLLMAMDRYSCDSEQMCRALGITRGKLKKELKRCGLLQEQQAA